MKLIAREALRNTRARLGLVAFIAGATALFSLGGMVLESNELRDIYDYERSLLDQGYTILIVEDRQSEVARLDSRDCRQLELFDQVGASAAIGTPSRRAVEPTGTLQHRVVAAEVGVVAILDALGGVDSTSWNGSQIIVDVDSALARGLNVGDSTTLTLGEPGAIKLAEAQIRDLSPLGAAFDGAILSLEPVRAAVACIAGSVVRDRNELLDSVRRSFAPEQGFSVNWSIPNASSLQPPRDRFGNRALKDGWMAAALTGLVLARLGDRIRRPDRLVYLTAGMNPRSVGLLAIGEYLWIYGLAFVAHWALAQLVVDAGEHSMLVRGYIYRSQLRLWLMLLLLVSLWSVVSVLLLSRRTAKELRGG